MTLAVRSRSGDLSVWVDDFERTAQVAGALARTPFVPMSLRVFRDNGRVYDAEATAANVAAAMLTGQELGMGPMAALRSVNVINGTPALTALAMRALLQRAGHDIWLVEANRSRATVSGQRAGSQQVQTVTWEMEDARDRGLAGRPNWRTQPRNMLIARATAEVARLIAGDALLGLAYSAEELQDEDVDTGPRLDSRPVAVTEGRAPVPPAPGRPRTVRRAPMPRAGAETQPVPHPAPGQVEAPGEAPEQAQATPERVYMSTNQQWKAMAAGFRDVGISDRMERLAQVSAWVGRDVGSAKDLYAAEAATVIDALREMKRAQAEREPGDTPAVDDEQAAADAALQAAWEADQPPLDEGWQES